MGKRERKKAYKDMIREINNTSGLRKSTFMADELSELKKDIKEKKESKEMREVVLTTDQLPVDNNSYSSNYQKNTQEGYIYFLDYIDIWRTKNNTPVKVVKLVSDNDVAFGNGGEILDLVVNDNYLFFIDENGNIARIPKPKSTKELDKIIIGLTKKEKLSLSAYNSIVNNEHGNEEDIEYSNYIKFHVDKNITQMEKIKAHEHEKYYDYTKAIAIYEKIGLREEAARVRKIIADQKKVDQTIVQGDQITKTEIKDSVLNRSNVGSGGSSKMQELKDLTEMKEKGLIDDDEFKQMKKEILGK